MLRPRGRSPALASLNKALGREVRNVCSVRGWGAGYVELCGSWLCFKTIPPTGVTDSSCWLPKGRGRAEMPSYLFSLRFKGAAPASSSPHLIISEQNCLLAVSNAKKKKKKTCFRCKAKLPIQMQKKKNDNKNKQRPLPVYPPRFRRLPGPFTAICCSYVDSRDARMDPKCKYLTCASGH